MLQFPEISSTKWPYTRIHKTVKVKDYMKQKIREFMALKCYRKIHYSRWNGLSYSTSYFHVGEMPLQLLLDFLLLSVQKQISHKIDDTRGRLLFWWSFLYCLTQEVKFFVSVLSGFLGTDIETLYLTGNVCYSQMQNLESNRYLGTNLWVHCDTHMHTHTHTHNTNATWPQRRVSE